MTRVMLPRITIDFRLVLVCTYATILLLILPLHGVRAGGAVCNQLVFDVNKIKYKYTSRNSLVPSFSPTFYTHHICEHIDVAID